jgi:glutamyl-tRNA reductase
MVLLCLTANHHNSSFELLEKLSIGAPTAAGALVDGTIAGAIVLATCNRFEAYLDVNASGEAASAAAIQATISVLSKASDLSVDDLRTSITVISGAQVVEHLFAVSVGLESVIVGEDEISGQVRRALERARVAGTTSSGLEQLFQKASHTSRGIKNTTALGGAGRSLVRLALELASSRIADWAEAKILIIGTGQYAGTTFAALRDRGATAITVFSASGRATKFAVARGIPVAHDLAEALHLADVVITCTSSVIAVVTPELLKPGKRQLIIDLGLPRNVDPRVADVEDVELLDLQTISLHAPLEELHATDDARAIIGSAAAEYSAELSVAPAVVALRKHVFDLLNAEIARARARGDANGQTEAALRHLAGVLLHTPSVRARELALTGDTRAFVDGLDSLFGIQSGLADTSANQSGLVAS